MAGRQLKSRKCEDVIRSPFDHHLVFIIENDGSLFFDLGSQDPNLIHVHVNSLSLSTRQLEGNKSGHVSLPCDAPRPR